MGVHSAVRGAALGLLLAVPVRSSAMAQASATASWQATPASVLKSALRAATAAQVRYFQSRKTYASSAEDLGLTVDRSMQITILAAGPTGWQARAVHVQRPGQSCVIFVGTLPGKESPSTDGDHEMAGEEGEPLCDTMR